MWDLEGAREKGEKVTSLPWGWCLRRQGELVDDVLEGMTMVGGDPCEDNNERRDDKTSTAALTTTPTMK